MSAFQDILSRAQGVASQPYTPYGGQTVAGLSPTQQTGIANVNAAYGTAQPYINTAADYARTGAAPVASVGQSDIERYLSPFNQNVINATMANINENNAQQQIQLRGNAALRGALGGDRAGVAQAELARHQALASNRTLAGLHNQNYAQALAQANTQQQNQQVNANRAAQAAYTFGNLGTTAQNAALQGAGAQIGAGALEQQNEQARLSAAQQEFMRAQAFPYQQTGWLAGLTAPMAGAMGGTQTTTPPKPSVFSQIAGLGLTAAGMYFGGPMGAAAGAKAGQAFARDGGRINYAEGGATPFDFINEADGYVPRLAIAAPPRPQFTDPSKQPGAPDPTKDITSGLLGLKFANPAGNPMNLSPTGGGWGQTAVGDLMPSANTGLPGFGGLYADGGFVDTVHALRRGLKRYDDGGAVSPADYVRRGWDDTNAAIADGSLDPQGWNFPRPVQTVPVSPAMPALPPAPMPAPAPRETMYANLPVEITRGTSRPVPEPDAAALGYDAESAPMAAPAGADPRQGGLLSALGLGGGSGLSEETRRGLIAAGLGMMSGTSPYGLSNIGQGGIKGMEAMAGYRKEQAEKQKHAENIALRKQSAALAGQRLAQQAAQFERTFGETVKQHEATQNAPKVVGASLVNPKTGEVIYTSTDSLLDPETLKFMAEQYRAGDTSVLTNLGRGAQGAQNIVRLRQEIQKQNAGMGLGGGDQAVRNAEYFGTKAGQRTLGTKQANIELAATEFQQVVPVVQEASKAVDRTKYPDINRLLQMAREKTGDPNIVAFGGGINTLINLYSRAISPTGVPTVSDKDHAREILNKAWSQGQFDAAVGMMQKEIDAALTSPEKVRDEMRKRFISGTKGNKPSEPASPTTSAPKVGDRKQFKQGVGVWNGTTWVPEGKQ